MSTKCVTRATLLASARQDTRHAAGPDGVDNFKRDHSDAELERFSHRRLLPVLQVLQEPQFQRGQKCREASARSIDALFDPEP